MEVFPYILEFFQGVSTLSAREPSGANEQLQYLQLWPDGTLISCGLLAIFLGLALFLCAKVSLESILKHQHQSEQPSLDS